MPETRTFTSRDFDRFARKERIGDAELLAVVESLESGAEDVRLGAHLFKQRIARRREGKSGGYRTVIVFRRGDRAVFVEGYAKNVKKAHPPEEVRALRAAAERVLSFSNMQIERLVEAGEFREIER